MASARSQDPVQPTDLLTSAPEPELVRELLREVIDPELGVNIVDLGLVYDVSVSAGAIAIVMTLTTPGCPLGGYIEDEIRACLRALPAVQTVAVEIVFEPPWDPQAMSDEAKTALGWFG